MKKFILFFICMMCVYINVSAKDSVFSINQYSDEEFQFIIKSYNEKGKNDGHVVAGTFLKKEKNEENEELEHTQVMIVKYQKNGSVSWNYHYGKTGEDEVYGLLATYDEEKNVNGYVAVVRETVEKTENKKDDLVFVVVGLDGKLVQEISANYKGTITNMIEVYDNEQKFQSYLLTGYNQNHIAFMMEYDSNFNLLWSQEYSDYNEFDEIIDVEDHFMILSSKIVDDKKNYQLLQFSMDDKNVNVVKDSFEEVDHPHIVSLNHSYLLYGITEEVKLSKKDAVGYYINKYNSNNEIEWDTIGDTAIDADQVLQLQPICNEGECLEYHLLYINAHDSSIEVLRISNDGTLLNKIKKIKNNYYHINQFISEGKTIYFIGQINCPEDDNCEYDSNSLYLVSSEDKVIEVKDNDSKKILIALGFIVLIIVGLLLIRKKQK